MTRISVVIPTYNRPTELRRCLEGFAAQSAGRDAFEIVVIDDGSALSVEPLAAEFAGALNLIFRRTANSGPSAARNLAIDLASGPLLLLYDDDLLPFPGVIEYCLQFHASHPAEGDAALLLFGIDPCVGDSAVIRWAFPRMYPFPPTPGVCDWKALWSGSSTCKKSIFRLAKFNEQVRILEDADLALRMARRVDLRVFFDCRILGLHTRPVTLPEVLRRAYMVGYSGCQLGRRYPGAYGADVAVQPETGILPPQELQSLLLAAKTLESKHPEVGSPAFRMLSSMWTRAYVHMHLAGWCAARDGHPPQPPAG